MLRAVIFDVDGTLIDSVDLHAEAWREAFQAFDRDIPFEKIRSQIGKGGDQLLPVFWSQEELANIERPLSEFRAELFRRNYLPRVVAFASTRELFQRILRDGWKIALASSANGDELQAYKRIARIEDLLDEETSKDDADRSKPHPDIFKAALTKLGHPDPGECLVVGDTPYDIEAAAKAGLRTIAVRCGGFPEETLRGAVAIYDDPAALLRDYETSPLAEPAGVMK